MGKAAGGTLNTGALNTLIGTLAGGGITSATQNTVVGHYAQRLNNVARCVCIGHKAGENNATDDRLYINNSDSAYPLIYGEFENDIIKFGDNDSDFFFKFSVSGATSTIEAGGVAGDDFVIKANQSNDYPYIKLFGGAEIRSLVTDTYMWRFYKNDSEYIRLYEGGGETIILGLVNDYIRLQAPTTIRFWATNTSGIFDMVDGGGRAELKSYQTNDNIYLNPNGSGLVQFGTYAAKGAEAFAGYITIDDAGGTPRKLMVCA